jgi:subtilase family serine protease
MQVRRVGTVLAAGSALVISGLSTPAFAHSAPSRVGVAKTKPAWLGHAKTLGRASSTGRTDFRVYLAPNGGTAALKSRVDAVSKPGSASYRHFITAPQFHQTYDPTSAAVAAVTKFLKDSKLSVTGVAANNQYLSVSGTVANAQSAFGTTINRYSHDGKTVQANSSTLTVPTTVADAVLAISGIDTTPAFSKPSKPTPAPPPPVFVNARPCSTFYGQIAAKYKADYKTPLPKFKGKTLPYSVCGYTGAQFRSAYENNSKLTGAGVTVAVVDAYAAPTIASDASTYAARHGDAPYAKGQLTQNNPSSYTSFAQCDPSGWFGEETLDVEAVHAMAPAANIRFYGGKSCFDNDLIDATQRVVNENKADLITNSYGDGSEQVSSQEVAAAEQVFLQGALQGQSFLFSSGDDGDDLASSGFLEPSYAASDPYVTAVGGTSDAIGSDGKFQFQTGWGTEKYTLDSNNKGWTSIGFTSGAGGGYSTLFNRPGYQKGVVPSSAPAGRAVPDVAMDADPTTGILVGETQTFPNGDTKYGEYRIGGTSVASPMFAGMTALTLQHAGGRLGFLNPTIYGQYKAGTFTDITGKSPSGKPVDAGNVRADYANTVNASDGLLYSVRVFNHDSSLTTTKGWDDVTGIGAPNSKWITSITSAN